MAPLRSLTSRISQQVWAQVHLRVGGRGQVRVNKGFKPQAFDTLGSALFFARWSKHLRAATVGHFVRSNVSPEAAAEIANPANPRAAGWGAAIAQSACCPQVCASLEEVCVMLTVASWSSSLASCIRTATKRQKGCWCYRFFMTHHLRKRGSRGSSSGLPQGSIHPPVIVMAVLTRAPAYVRQIEKGEITPSLECQKQLEKIVGAPLTPPRKRTKRPKL
ncbi:hypothetical protein Emed_001405 [Eimeria media]